MIEPEEFYYFLITFFIFPEIEFLKDTFRRSVTDEDENGFYVLFLVARQVTRYNVSLLGDYATWWASLFLV